MDTRDSLQCVEVVEQAICELDSEVGRLQELVQEKDGAIKALRQQLADANERAMQAEQQREYAVATAIEMREQARTLRIELARHAEQSPTTTTTTTK
jgi:predicted  nucleic acid-binding Zn-ribbon protein